MLRRSSLARCLLLEPLEIRCNPSSIHPLAGALADVAPPDQQSLPDIPVYSLVIDPRTSFARQNTVDQTSGTHEVGHTLGFRHEHTVPATTSDGSVRFIKDPIATGVWAVEDRHKGSRSSGELASFFAFPGFTGGISVAAGDVNGDQADDIIVGATANGHVKVFDGTSGAEIRSFFAFSGFLGGISVGAGDVNGDKIDDVIVGAGVNGHVKVFDGTSGAEIRSFLAFPGFTGGISVAGGDVNGDKIDDIIVGAAVNGHVKVFDGIRGAEIRSFFAFPGFTGGVSVAGGDVNGDGFDDIIVGSTANGHVKAFDGASGAEIRSFFAFPGFFGGGVSVGAGDVNGDGIDDIIVGAGRLGTPPHVKVFSAGSGQIRVSGKITAIVADPRDPLGDVYSHPDLDKNIWLNRSELESIIDDLARDVASHKGSRSSAELASFFAFPGFTGGVSVAGGDVNGDGFADLIVGAGPGSRSHVK